MQTAHRATRGVGPDSLTVIVRSIDSTGMAYCNAVGTNEEVVVPISPQRAKGGAPKVAEAWLINREFGRWGFAALMVWTKPVVTGAKAGNTPLALSLLAAMIDLGLITDSTT